MYYLNIDVYINIKYNLIKDNVIKYKRKEKSNMSMNRLKD